MRHILHNYKLRLTNISQSNRSLKLARISPKTSFDVVESAFLENDSAEDIFRKILAGKTVKLVQKLDARLEKTNEVDKHLNQLFRQIETIEEETGTYNVYVGYPFVEGKFADGSIARCPLILFPVKLIRNLQSRPRWSIEKLEDADIQWNPTFFLAYEQYQKQRLNPEFWEENIEYSDDWQDWLNKLYAIFTKYEIEINFNSALFEFKLESFPKYLKETLNNFELGKLICKPQTVLGIFPQSASALLKDYEIIEKQPELFDIERYILAQNSDNQINTTKYISEEKRHFVSDLDQSQEEVLLNMKAGKSLVVHGPPGTGKSQVIVNMIADALAEGKKVLVVSQKRAALDVVYKRLSAVNLNRFAVLVHDQQADRTAIFAKIRKQIQDLPENTIDLAFVERVKANNEYALLAKQCDELNLFFEELFQNLTQKQACGMSAHELYVQNDAKVEKLDFRKVAKKMNLPSLNVFLNKLQQICEYSEFFEAEYAWRNRLSFHHYRFDDKPKIAAKINAIPPIIKDLHQKYKEISPILEKDIFEEKENQKRIAYFQKIENFLSDKNTEKWISAIYKDELTPAYIKEMLGNMDEAFESLGNCKIIDILSFSSCLDLVGHLHIYEQKKQDAFRFLSFSFLKARWFIRKVLKMRNLEFDEKVYKRLQSESQKFQVVWQLYTEIQPYAFFEDFPIYDNSAQVNGLSAGKFADNWLISKQEQLKCYEFIENLPFLQSHKPKYVFGILQTENWQKSLSYIYKLADFTEKLSKLKEESALFLHSKQIGTFQNAIIWGNNEYFEKLLSSFESDFEELQNLDILFSNFSVEESECFAILDIKMREKMLIFTDLSAQIRNNFYFYWIENIENELPILKSVSARGFLQKQQSFSELLAKKREKVSQLINRKLQDEMQNRVEYNRLKSPITYREIAHQVSKKRQIWSVRKLVENTWNQGLATLMPCWMASPESVSAIFPMEQSYFDLVIFDEASQCFVERAVPVILRGKQVVIAGDEKQLPPFDMYSVKVDDAEMEFAEAEIAMEVESALNLAKANFEGKYLTWHYRSQSEELIRFSNEKFYEGKLQMIPSVSQNADYQPYLEWISVAGIWKNNANLIEAEKIVSLILEIIQRPDRPTLGVVTFNFHQQELIKDLLEAKLESFANENNPLFELLQNALYRTQNEEFVGLFVKNIENVQGDERDIILFSVGYAKNEQGKLQANFGLLNLQGGENRLNVAITRARLKIYVVCSFYPSELAVEHSKHEGPKMFKRYLESVYAGNQTYSLLNQALPSSTSQNLIVDFLAKKLAEKGYIFERNVGNTRYKIDLAIRKSDENSPFTLAIECEGTYYFSGTSAKEREVYRRQLLLQNGWRFYRVWARNFWANADAEIEKIERILKEIS